MASPSPYEDPVPVPQPDVKTISAGISLIDTICRKGTGPGLIVLVDEASKGLYVKDGIPSPMQKWGEEGYCVVEVTHDAWTKESNALRLAIEALKSHPNCTFNNGFGIVSYEPASWAVAAPQLSSVPEIVAAVLYDDASAASHDPTIPIPVLGHYAGKLEGKLKRSLEYTQYDYPGQSPYFASPGSAKFNYAAEAVSHTRSLTHLKPLMKGPYFDLESLWDEHTYYEFAERSVEKTMNTMVAEPYVNHIPTITGGIGRRGLTDFYANHFIFSNPEGTELELVSRTVGIDRVVDEFIFKFNHNRQVDWLLPGVPPTGVDCEIPFMAVVNIRGDRLYHEHIHWDSASALRQVGCLPEYTPLATQPAKSAANGGEHRQILVQVPTTGTDTAAKLRDKNAVPSNEMFAYTVKNGETINGSP